MMHSSALLAAALALAISPALSIPLGQRGDPSLATRDSASVEARTFLFDGQIHQSKRDLAEDLIRRVESGDVAAALAAREIIDRLERRGVDDDIAAFLRRELAEGDVDDISRRDVFKRYPGELSTRTISQVLSPMVNAAEKKTGKTVSKVVNALAEGAGNFKSGYSSTAAPAPINDGSTAPPIAPSSQSGGTTAPDTTGTNAQGSLTQRDWMRLMERDAPVGGPPSPASDPSGSVDPEAQGGAPQAAGANPAMAGPKGGQGNKKKPCNKGSKQKPKGPKVKSAKNRSKPKKPKNEIAIEIVFQQHAPGSQPPLGPSTPAPDTSQNSAPPSSGPPDAAPSPDNGGSPPPPAAPPSPPTAPSGSAAAAPPSGAAGVGASPAAPGGAQPAPAAKSRRAFISPSSNSFSRREFTEELVRRLYEEIITRAGDDID